MERRFLTFLVLSFGIMAVWQILNPPKPPAKKPDAAAAAAEDEKEEAVAADEAAGDKPAGQDADGDGADDAEAAQPLEFVTLGSIDPATGYRMGVTLTNQGAAVHRIELSSARYQDLHDRRGYLGQLELTVGNGEGLLVGNVIPGSPAAVASMKTGDRIVEAGGEKPEKIATLEDFQKVLGAIRPGQEATLVVLRDGQRQSLTAKLGRRPLELIRPESENVALRTGKPAPLDFVSPPSFLMTLTQLGDKKATDAKPLAGVDLETANWRRIDAPAGGDGEVVSFERKLAGSGLVVTKTYRLRKAPEKEADGAALPAYDLTVEVAVRNDGEAKQDFAYQLDGPNGLPIEGWWYATKIGRNWGGVGLRDVIGRYFNGDPTQFGAATVAAGDAKPLEGANLAYMGVDAQYFCVALIPNVEKPEQSDWVIQARSVVAGTPPSTKPDGRFANVSTRFVSKPFNLEPGDAVRHSYTVFSGPKRPDLLAEYKAANEPNYSLSDFVYYGWFGAVAKTMLGLLHFFYGIVGNYGIAIIMLTVLVRGCMFPVSRGQAKSMAKMQALKPEMDRIKERYKGDQQKQAAAMQDLYRKHSVNPLAGCLPALIQLPIFLGLYRGLAVDVELRQAPLFGDSIRWCSNLAAPDMLYDWSWFMPDAVTSGQGMFALGPYLNVLPLVTVALFLLQQKLFMPEPANEQAAMQQKIMKYMMVFMGLMFYKVPSGLCLYFIASSLWGIAEKKMIPPPATPVVGTGTSTDLSPTRNGGSGGKYPEKRPGKNGDSRNRNPKRKR
ncbi:YidC/Oxa1 family insertase periplasmic-domain containing protein [Lacipirellula sp.]|uniref:YidC/Oxa1 family insertase periplasmic-domain containing protein n=1 Tax=Lacipirellula sp. TaxID=2691419 RepID=UPI003D0BD348